MSPYSPLGVLPDKKHIDVADTLVSQRTLNAGQKLNRPQIDILVEVLPDREDHLAYADVVRHIRMADRPKINRVVFFQNIQRVIRHTLTVLQIKFRAPWKLVNRKFECIDHLAHFLKHLYTFRYYLLSHAIPWQ